MKQNIKYNLFWLWLPTILLTIIGCADTSTETKSPNLDNPVSDNLIIESSSSNLIDLQDIINNAIKFEGEIIRTQGVVKLKIEKPFSAVITPSFETRLEIFDGNIFHGLTVLSAALFEDLLTQEYSIQLTDIESDHNRLNPNRLLKGNRYIFSLVIVITPNGPLGVIIQEPILVN